MSSSGTPVLLRPAPAWWQDTRIRTLIKVLFLIGVGGVAAYGKSVSLPLGIPGSSAVLWLAPMVIGYLVVPKRGAGLLIGASVALWGIPLGINHALFYNLGLYGGTGLALDIAGLLPRINVRNPLGAVFCGAFAHMVKFGFIVVAAMTSTVTRHFLVVGLAQSALLHLGFGIAAGIVGWVVYKAAHKAWQASQRKS